ncbi:MAG: two-component system sensor histidine kinase DesK [Paracoccaceae bacterium]|jgi:two-component system sensor histidine kinase DesK
MEFSLTKLTENLLNLAGIAVIILVSSVSILNEQNSDYWLFIIALSVAVPLLYILFLGASEHSSQRLLFILQGAAIAVLFFLVKNSFTAILSIVWIVQASEIFSTKKTLLLLVASATLYTFSQLIHLDDQNLTEVLVGSTSFALFQVFAFSASQRAISERKLREETATLNRELLATRELLSQSAAQGERVRISRDLHDILGHHMTALILNLEVANHKTEGDANDKVQQSLSLAKLLLSDIRTAVSELRHDDNINLEQSIAKLTDDIPDIEFKLDFSAAPEVKSLNLAEALLRSAQEAITNVLRHSQASQCLIQLRSQGDSCLLQIKDNGISGGNNFTAGNGITGMTERIQALNGQLICKQSESGFSVSIELPLDRAL